MASFEKAIDGLLKREGGFVNDPDDSGGKTKYGISQRQYPLLDIEHLTKADAADIYFEDYWRPMSCDQFSSQVVANVLLDFGVNAGPKRSIKTLQKALGVAVDGIVGPITAGAANDSDGELIAMRMTVLRIDYYARIASRRKSQVKFLVGWINRALEVLND